MQFEIYRLIVGAVWTLESTGSIHFLKKKLVFLCQKGLMLK